LRKRHKQLRRDRTVSENVVLYQPFMVGVYDNDEQVKKKKRNVAVCQLAEDFDTSIAGAVTF